MKRDAVIRMARQEVLRKQAEEATQRHLQEEMQKGEFEHKARGAPPLEVSLVEKKPSLMKRVKKSFSIAGCKGNKATMNTVDESAFHQS